MNEYNQLDTENSKEEYYSLKRKRFSDKVTDTIARSAMFWFLMKTGYNGVYRVNSKKKFNVPFGKNIELILMKTFLMNYQEK